MSPTPVLPIMQLNKSVNPDTAEPGDTVLYAITYSNTGLADEPSFVIIDSIDPYLNLLSVSPPGSYDNIARLITWNMGTVPGPSGPVTVSFTAVVADDIPKGRNITNIAFGGGVPSNTTTVRVDVPDLILTKITTYPNPARDNAVILFKITVYAKVTIQVYTISGELVRSMNVDNTNLVDVTDTHGVISDVRAGENRVEWDTLNNSKQKVSSGIYFYRVDAATLTNEKTHYIDKLAVMR
jgi:uncharacterized repeat protein (TIGR01451 family)